MPFSPRLPSPRRRRRNPTQKLLRKPQHLPPRRLRLRGKRDEKFEPGFYTHTYDLGRFVDHLLNGLTPAPSEVRIHPRQGTSDPNFRWGDRENIIYEVIR